MQQICRFNYSDFKSATLLVLAATLLVACSPSSTELKKVPAGDVAPEISEQTAKPFTDDEASSRFGDSKAILYSAYRSAVEATVKCMASRNLDVAGPSKNIDDFRYLQWTYTTTNKESSREADQIEASQIEASCEKTYLEKAASTWVDAQRVSSQELAEAKSRILLCLGNIGIEVEPEIKVEQLAQIIERSSAAYPCAQRDIGYFDVFPSK